MSQLADVLAARSQELLQRWVEAVRRHVAPGGESRVELEDHIPRFLEQLEAVLRGRVLEDRTSPEAGTNPVGREHGAQRFRLGFALGALVREYGLLRDVLLDVIEQEGIEVPLAEVRLLTDFVSTAISEAVEEHSHQERRLRMEVQRSQEWLSTVLRSIGDAVIVTDAEGRAVFLNPVAETLTGWTEAEARGEPLARVFPLLHEGTHARVDSPVDRVLREGRGRGLAHPALLVRKNGAHLPIDESAAPLRDASGGISGGVLVFRDISEKKRQEAERERQLQETERLRTIAEGKRDRLDALLLQAPVAITVLRGPQLFIDLANPLMLRLWGRPRERILDKPLLEAMPELRGHGFDDLLRGVMATGEPFVATELEVQFARGVDGALETGYFNFTYAAMRDERGRIEGALIIATEVTEMVLARRKVESLLRRSQEAEQARSAVLNALSEQTLVAVSYQRGPELIYETANSVYRQMVGRDVVGLSALQALPEVAGQHGFPSHLTQVLETGQPYVVREVPVQMARVPGGPLRQGLFDLTYQPVRAPGGGVDGVLALVFEVTEQVRLRQAAQRLADEERKRSDFEQHLIGIVSHDLRNPLGAISLGIQVLLRRGGLDARTHQSLDRIQSSTERAVRMVRDLLDFTQARLGGGLKMERAPMELHALVRGVVEELQVAYPERELRLEQHGDGRGQWDADRVTQMLGNLLVNALKYSPEDSPVTVRSEGGTHDIRLEVHNGGAPIPPQALERLFQPLQRAVEGTSADRSVGLGLYIVDQIVQAHGGDIHVTSTEHAGTTFSVRLPRPP